ncbi:hypothetical protein [Tahibacter amnicola]|uniref:Delta-60 repeat protein n=1 Tax=Tahibacter amnicola TaxID=2976241 RepID=A0ABY6BQX1_9GAMM|nr:hypothetical protein [Tahibacter amnicola]UXI70167.1 hypothetical protein N4264_11205 [Tahibacter amnicola]
MVRSLCFTVLALAASTALGREGDRDERFSEDGQQTLRFDTGTTKRDEATAVLVDRNGRYLVVGMVESGYVGLAAFKPDGSIDADFGINGKIAYGAPLVAVTAATMDVLGRTIVVGFGLDPAGNFDFDPVVCRYTAAGQRDTTVSSSGCRTISVDKMPNGSDTLSAVTTDGAGQIYVAGQAQISAEDADFLVMKLASTDASPLSTFAGNGMVVVAFDANTSHAGGDIDGAQAIVLQGNHLTVGGYADNELGNDFALMRISALNGAEDTTFCPTTAACPGTDRTQGLRTIGFNFGGTNDDRIRALAVAPDGNIVVAGETERLVEGAVSTNYLVTRIGPTGAFALPFGSSVAQYDRIYRYLNVTGLAVRTDGKIVLAGHTSTEQTNVSPNRILWVAQMSATGAPDNQFATDLGGGPSNLQIAVFPTAPSSTVLDHHAGQLTLDHGRIVLAASALWRRDMPNSVDDFDFAVLRLKGDSLFNNGFQP